MTTVDTLWAGRREWIGPAVLALACLLYVIMQTAATIGAIIAVGIAILAVVMGPPTPAP
jgi:hypothetical protein